MILDGKIEQRQIKPVHELQDISYTVTELTNTYNKLSETNPLKKRFESIILKLFGEMDKMAEKL